MSVKTILARKGSHVSTVHPDAAISDVVETLARERIGALVVTGDDGRVRGIISERDIVRELAARGPAILRDPTARHMTRNVITCQLHDSVDDMLATMTHGKFRHLPVLDGDRLGGIISLGDLIHFRMQEIEREADHLRNYIAAG